MLLPGRWVMIFSAYRLAEDAATFTHVHRYGAATLVLYRALFGLFAPHHDLLVATSRVAGILTMPLLLAGFLRLRPPSSSVPVAAVGLALLPVFVRDHVSESNLVPVAFWLGAGLLLLDAGLVDQARAKVAGALVFLALALTGRPEMLAIVPLLTTAVLLARRASWRKHLLVLGILALLAIPHALHVLQAARTEAAEGELSLGRLLLRLPVSLGPLWPRVFPLGVTGLALLSVRHPQRRGTRMLLLGLVPVWVATLLVDLPDTSVPRLEAPVCAVVLLVAAWGLTLEPRRWRVPLAVISLVSALPTLALFRTTNEDVTEHVWTRALPLLPHDHACLVTLGQDDPPRDPKVHRSIPAYLLRPPHRDLTRLSMSAWQDHPELCPHEAFLLIDHRCWARYHTKPGEHGMLPVCADLVRTARPIDVRAEPSRGDNEYGYWTGLDGQVLPLGLYRLK